LLIGFLGLKFERKTVERFLSLLISLNLIIKKPYSNNVYYLSYQKDAWLKFGFKKESKNTDIERWASEFQQYYRSNEPKKMRALKAHYKKLGIIGDKK